MNGKTFAGGAIDLTLDRIARLQLNRPRVANALNTAAMSAIIEVCDVVANARDVRVLIISGVGKNFCAGADITEFESAYASDETAEAYNNNYRAVEEAVRALPMPVIAQIRGACVGGGLGIALCADFRFADPTARMAVTASKLGIAYSAEDSARVIEKIGPVNTKDMLYSARIIEANEALAWRLIDRLVPESELSRTVDAYASLLAERSTASLKATKRIIDTLMAPRPELCTQLRPIYSQLFRGSDVVEGRKAFLEKRAPKFE